MYFFTFASCEPLRINKLTYSNKKKRCFIHFSGGQRGSIGTLTHLPRKGAIPFFFFFFLNTCQKMLGGKLVRVKK